MNIKTKNIYGGFNKGPKAWLQPGYKIPSGTSPHIAKAIAFARRKGQKALVTSTSVFI